MLTVLSEPCLYELSDRILEYIQSRCSLTFPQCKLHDIYDEVSCGHNHAGLITENSVVLGEERHFVAFEELNCIF